MLEFDVPGMSCSHCVTAVTEAVRSVDPAAAGNVDLAGHTVGVDTAEPREQVAAALEDAGYAPG